MPHFEPVNDRFLYLDGVNLGLQVYTSTTLGGLNTFEATIDCEFATTSAIPRLFFGVAPSLATDFQMLYTASGTLIGKSIRTGGTTTVTTAASAISPGKRAIITLKDDGTTVTLYVNGVSKATGTSASGDINFGSQFIEIGHDTIAPPFGAIKVYGCQLKKDGKVVFRFVPREESGTTLRDLSGYDQRIIFTPAAPQVEGTNFYWGSAWNLEPMFPGGVTL